MKRGSCILSSIYVLFKKVIVCKERRVIWFLYFRIHIQNSSGKGICLALIVQCNSKPVYIWATTLFAQMPSKAEGKIRSANTFCQVRVDILQSIAIQIYTQKYVLQQWSFPIYHSPMNYVPIYQVVGKTIMFRQQHSIIYIAMQLLYMNAFLQ